MEFLVSSKFILLIGKWAQTISQNLNELFETLCCKNEWEKESPSLNLLNFHCKNFNIYQVVIFLTALSLQRTENKTTRVNGRRLFLGEAPQRFSSFFCVNLDGDDATPRPIINFLSVFILFVFMFVSCFTTTTFSDGILKLFTAFLHKTCTLINFFSISLFIFCATFFLAIFSSCEKIKHLFT